MNVKIAFMQEILDGSALFVMHLQVTPIPSIQKVFFSVAEVQSKYNTDLKW